jgi:hypothetical protein
MAKVLVFILTPMDEEAWPPFDVGSFGGNQET